MYALFSFAYKIDSFIDIDNSRRVRTTTVTATTTTMATRQTTIIIVHCNVLNKGKKKICPGSVKFITATIAIYCIDFQFETNKQTNKIDTEPANANTKQTTSEMKKKRANMNQREKLRINNNNKNEIRRSRSLARQREQNTDFDKLLLGVVVFFSLAKKIYVANRFGPGVRLYKCENMKKKKLQHQCAQLFQIFLCYKMV